MGILPFSRGLFKVKSNPVNMETEGAIKCPYSQTPLYGHPLNYGHLIIMDSLLCSIRKKALPFYMIVFSDIKI